MKKCLTVIEKFDAAHHLEGYVGPCAEVHGHTWKVEAVFSYKTCDSIGIAADFKTLKSMLKRVLPDHKNINTWLVDNFDEHVANPTAELLSFVFFTKINTMLQEYGGDLAGNLALVKIKVWESDSAYASLEA